MNRYLLLLIFQFLGYSIQAQVIGGIITDSKNNTLPGANVYLKGTYDGTIADVNGKYEIKTKLLGKQTLVVTNIGFQNFETILDIFQGGVYKIDVTLTSKSTQLNEVVITAGTFEAGDKKRNIQLQALDILTTANSNGDIYQALNTLPGAQKVGEEAVETVIEATNGTEEGFIYEASDLMYHLIVLLTSKGYSLDDLARELKKRHK